VLDSAGPGSERPLIARLLQVEERERRRIALGLHDGVGQELATAKLLLDGVQRLAPAEVAAPLNEVMDLLRTSMESLRSLSFELASSVLYEFGLDAAIESTGRRICEENGLQFSFHADGGRRAIGEDTALALHRSARELMRNVVRHARADHLDVRISQSERLLRISVADDGIGLEEASVCADHFGLVSVRAELASIGGRLELRSSRGMGTCAALLVRLPPATT